MSQNYKLYPKCRTISAEQMGIIVELYNDGIPIPKIAERLSMNNYVSIVKFLEFNNIRKKPTRQEYINKRTKYTKLDSMMINQMIDDKKSRREIAEAVGCNIHLIKKYIKENDLSLIDYEQHKFRDMLIGHKDDVIKLYENCKNLRKVGEYFDCSGEVVADFLKAIGYLYTKKNHVDLTPYLEEIRKLYYDQNLTLLEIGEKFKCSSVKVGDFLKANGYLAKDKSELLRTRNSSEEFQKKCISSSGRKKKYTLPSGKEISLRGYEPNFLDYVFENKILSEDEIDYTPKRIKYIFEGKSCHYYPDFYIPKFNLIVETKSSWIYKKQGDLKNNAKEKATREQNFNFLYVLNNNFEPFINFITNIY